MRYSKSVFRFVSYRVVCRGSLVRSIHYTVTSTSRKPKEQTAVDSLSEMDTLGPQWNERRNESFSKLKEIILSTSKVIIPTPPATVFYEEATQSFPLYTPVQRYGDKPKLHFQVSSLILFIANVYFNSIFRDPNHWMNPTIRFLHPFRPSFAQRILMGSSRAVWK